jgi:hypothetical protein
VALRYNELLISYYKVSCTPSTNGKKNLTPTKLSRQKRYHQNSFCQVARGWGGEGGGRVLREGQGEGGRNDPNIVCTYE